ncbi:hypothetical protein AGMMS50212_10310 [Spirochaetia bacterium]|nr:hypothetical protein AGMMS50212_10310 [Spirochaetia bacterium]
MSLVINLTDQDEINLNMYKGFNNFQGFCCLLISAYNTASFSKYCKYSNHSIFENKERIVNSLNNPKPLLFDHFCYKGETIVLASKGGVGKSLMSIEVVKNPNVKKALFLLLEDYSGKQLVRYTNALPKDKFEIISCSKWREICSSVKYAMVSNINKIAVFDSKMPIFCKKLQQRREELLKKYNIQETQGLDNILVYEYLMDNIVNLGFDFICIDSLNALLGNPNRICRSVLERIIQKTTEFNMTLLIIHHINKKGEITGNSDLVNVVDSAYILNIESENNLSITEIKSRHKINQEKAIFERISKNQCEVEYKLKDVSPYSPSDKKDQSGLTAMEKLITDAFEGSNIISHDELNAFMADKNYTNTVSIENCLKRLVAKNILKKADGKKWDQIELVAQTQN